MEWIPVGHSARSIPSDWCTFLRHSMVMPARMMGKLTVEEWRPLIASSIVFENKEKRRLRGRAFLLTGMPLIVSLALPISVAFLLQRKWIFFLYPFLALPLDNWATKTSRRDLKK